MSAPIGDPRQSGEEGPAGDTRQAGEEGPAGDPRPGGQATPGEHKTEDKTPPAKKATRKKA